MSGRRLHPVALFDALTDALPPTASRVIEHRAKFLIFRATNGAFRS